MSTSATVRAPSVAAAVLAMRNEIRSSVIHFGGELQADAEHYVNTQLAGAIQAGLSRRFPSITPPTGQQVGVEVECTWHFDADPMHSEQSVKVKPIFLPTE